MPDYALIARELEAAARAARDVAPLIRQRAPRIVNQIARDARCATLLNLWGRSLNIDENTGTIIIPVPVIEALSALAGVAAGHPVVHAGIAHTYGYLFSPIETPYGYKRDRWVNGLIERAGGLPEGTLRPEPQSGTLLANLTYFLGRIVFRGRRREQAYLRRCRSLVSAAVSEFNYRRIRPQRIVEQLRLRRGREVTLCTDLIPSQRLSSANGRGNPLLIYWTSDTETSTGTLITAFPISPEVVVELLEPKRFGRSVEIRTRYNAWIPGLSGRRMYGERQLL